MNKGFKCEGCGWIGEKPAERSIMKIKYKCCPDCREIVKPYITPLNERAGRCRNCAGHSFRLRAQDRAIIRICAGCGEELNTMTMEVIKNGQVWKSN
jgi:hypothetical protein